MVAICRRSHKGARSAADRWKIARVETDWRRVIRAPDIDAISIAVPPTQQAVLGRAALEAGKHVLFEKPVDPIGRLSDGVMRSARRSNLVAMVNFEFPELTTWRRARSLIVKGAIGRVRHVMVDWSVGAIRFGAQSGWKASPENGGGMLWNFGPHILHYVESYFGAVASLQAERRWESGKEGPVDTAVHLSLRTAERVSISVCLDGKKSGGSNVHRVRIDGERGRIVLENADQDYAAGFRLLRWKHGATAPSFSMDEGRSHHGDGRIPAVARIVKRFIDAISKKGPIDPSLEWGIRVDGLIRAVARADRSGRRILIAGRKTRREVVK